MQVCGGTGGDPGIGAGFEPENDSGNPKRSAGTQIEYRVCGIEEYGYPENRWDCVVSNLALHYIENEAVFQNVYGTLKRDGVFLFNIEHPVFTAGRNDGNSGNER